LISGAFPVLILLRALLPLPCRWLSYSGLSVIQVSISSTFLSTHFSYERRFSSFYYVHATRKSCQNEVRTKNLYVKRWWNWHQIPFKVTCHFFSWISQNLSKTKKGLLKVRSVQRSVAWVFEIYLKNWKWHRWRLAVRKSFDHSASFSFDAFATTRTQSYKTCLLAYMFFCKLVSLLHLWMSRLGSCSVSINRCKSVSVSCRYKWCYNILTVQKTLG